VRPVIVGGFDRDSEWRHAMEQRLAREDVTFLRDAEPEAVSRAMYATDVAVLPYDSGTGPNRSSMLTAMQHGLPVVSTDGPATPSGFARTCPAVFVPPRSTEAIVQAVASLLDEPDRRNTLGASGRMFVAEQTWPAVASRHLCLYQQVASGAAHNAAAATAIVTA
jgi:glycosyltransferase involved in cell wall biosynthesis